MSAPVSSFVQQGWITLLAECAEASWGKSTRQEKGWQQAACKESEKQTLFSRNQRMLNKNQTSQSSPAEGLPRVSEHQADLRKCRNDGAKGCWLSADWVCSIQPIQLPPTCSQQQRSSWIVLPEGASRAFALITGRVMQVQQAVCFSQTLLCVTHSESRHARQGQISCAGVELFC